ncbi:tRNA glutamyl-Q(34) synthetase GluQRS [Fluviispira multicolorata]|uniref:tRNA glutamyl-Q(34) synthetase GluQRS n=1 Tax=Fluviispira multicolorata TaxID=2654512 RepID=A0A833N415_9BACT|nr:tRNA glutamyl-Q(34) synthetase GluQRS [Fluviispira multicolorata]KAB8030934.1 tRNA glutamyl-Q(34) synthetase GluQRS [Fluviispira multicolorata]
MHITPVNYIGRFAPSPTGKLHFGSLVTAIASYLRARSQSGKWLVRIEDVDTTRIQKDAIYSILTVLEQYGFQWDDEIIYQSKRSHIYQDYLKLLKSKEFVYNCICNRKGISQHDIQPQTGEAIYRGRCRNLNILDLKKHSKRIKVNNIEISFIDLIYGMLKQNIMNEVGDFTIWRVENFASYQLAVVIDDHLQGITEVVRGSDLLLQTPRQIYLQKYLDFKTPSYAHIPIVVNELGQKLSKQTKAYPLLMENSRENIFSALKYLGINSFFISIINDESKNNAEILINSAKYFKFNLVKIF